ncbi:MAG: hypothetical protein Q8Q09_05360 [Deltaproteobacteria bacterium]|nr:hypothetical protein [Deltaproteobacteria bacterium]
MIEQEHPLHEYVRFYLRVLEQLDQAHQALAVTRTDVLSTVHSFAEVLTAAHDPAAWYGATADAVSSQLHTHALWRPEDVLRLSGLTDVYEVVGRFTFQGEDDQNISTLTEMIAKTQADIDAQRTWLAALAKVPSGATLLAEGLSQQELAAQTQRRQTALEPFEPVARELRVQCTKVLDAVRALAPPDVTSIESAEANYQDYVRRLQSLYTTALPYLRRSLEDLCKVAQVDTPPSWPDSLPFSQTLPAELMTAPPTEGPTVIALRQQLAEAEGQIQNIVRGVEECNLAQRKREQDKLAALAKDTELEREVDIAKNTVRWTTKLDELDQMQQALSGQAQQRDGRATLVAQLQQQYQQIELALVQTRGDVTNKENEITALAQKLQETRDAEPTLFGKEEWRQKVAQSEQELRERRELVAQRRNVLGETERQFAAVQTRLSAENTQLSLSDRIIAEAHARAESLRNEVLEIEKQLGTHRPPRRLATAQADEFLTGVWGARNETRARIEALTNQHRNGTLEIERLAAQGRQWTAERERLRGALEQARKANTLAQENTLRELSTRRQQGVSQYIARTLAPLEESLSQVDKIFVDPARQVLLQRAGDGTPKAGTLRAKAEQLAQALAQLAPRIEPALTAQAAVLEALQRDFVAKWKSAVTAAWT